MNASAKLNDIDDEPRKATKKASKVSAIVIGLSSAFFVILARDDVAPAYFDSIGKSLFWTGMILIPLLNLNRDLLRFPSAIIVLAALFCLQGLLVFLMFGRLENLDFVILAPLCFIQCLIFFAPLMLIRKRHVGIWY